MKTIKNYKEKIIDFLVNKRLINKDYIIKKTIHELLIDKKIYYDFNKSRYQSLFNNIYRSSKAIKKHLNEIEKEKKENENQIYIDMGQDLKVFIEKYIDKEYKNSQKEINALMRELEIEKKINKNIKEKKNLLNF